MTTSKREKLEQLSFNVFFLMCVLALGFSAMVIVSEARKPRDLGTPIEAPPASWKAETPKVIQAEFTE